MEEYGHQDEATELLPQRSVVTRIFFTTDEFRFRAGWRLLIFVLLLFIVLALTVMVASWFQVTAWAPSSIAVQSLLEVLLVTLAVLLARRLIDHRSLVSLGLELDRQMLPNLLFGFLLGGVLMGGIFTVLYAMGWLHVEGFAWPASPLPSIIGNSLGLLFGIGLLIGWSEELLFRGYVLQNLRDGVRLPAALILSSVLFGLIHFQNPATGWRAILGISLAGIMLAYGRISTGKLWLPIGLHAGWNFFQAVVFGFPVSGLNLFHLTRITTPGPALVTGGAFGPEAGLVVVPAVLIGIGCIHCWQRQFQQNSVTSDNSSNN